MSFPRYPKYKSSGVEWLGDVPEHWVVKPLKTVASFNDDVLPESYGADEEIEYVDIGSVSLAGGIERTETLKYGNAPSRARRRVRNGDVIASTVRTYLKAISPIIDPPGNMIVSTGFAVIRPSVGLMPAFAKFALQTSFFVEAVISLSTGVSYPAINASEMARISIPVPPIDQQSAIASFLDRETAKIDALVAEQRRLMELLKEKRQATISHAVTRGLNPNTPLKDSGIEWLGEVPAHWSVIALKRIAEVHTGVAKGKDNSSRQTITVPYLRVANVQDGYLDLETVSTIEIPAEDLERYSLKAGDVLMNEGGDFDKLGRGHIWEGQIDPCITQNHVFAVRPRAVSSNWLNSITSSDFAQFYFMTRSKQSTNLASISSTNLMELPVILPPEHEQLEILSFIADQTAHFDTLTTEAQRAIDLLQERRTALISAAVTGQIDVRAVTTTP